MLTASRAAHGHETLPRRKGEGIPPASKAFTPSYARGRMRPNSAQEGRGGSQAQTAGQRGAERIIPLIEIREKSVAEGFLETTVIKDYVLPYIL